MAKLFLVFTNWAQNKWESKSELLHSPFDFVNELNVLQLLFELSGGLLEGRQLLSFLLHHSRRRTLAEGTGQQRFEAFNL